MLKQLSFFGRGKPGRMILIAVGIFCTFTLFYKLLQHENIYAPTLGKITFNYEKILKNDTAVTRAVNKPYSKFIEQQACNWDAEYYLNIRDSMYTGAGNHALYRYAFFPFFPMVWKATHANVHGMIFLNYLFFAAGIFLLWLLFLKNSESGTFFFSLALLLPTVTVFYLPYTESLFLFTFVLAIVGLVNRKYLLYFLAMVCFTMTRPVALILSIALVCAAVMDFWKHKNILRFLKESFLLVIPISVGWYAVKTIEYFYSHSWNIYDKACSLWPKKADLRYDVTDWSSEGFGMNVFAMFFVALPIIIYVIVWINSILFSKEKKNVVPLFSGDRDKIKSFLFNVSALFIMGLSIFDLLTNGFELNGFFRYTMATPFFYIILFQLHEKLKSIPFHYKISAFVILLLGIILFLFSTWYAADLVRFSYLGLLLLLLLTLLVLIEQCLSNKIKIILLIAFAIPCLVWQTYLFNMYLGDAWIFT